MHRLSARIYEMLITYQKNTFVFASYKVNMFLTLPWLTLMRIEMLQLFSLEVLVRLFPPSTVAWDNTPHLFFYQHSKSSCFIAKSYSVVLFLN